MPLTRPAAISDGVSLSDKLGREVAAWRFVAEYRALDTFLLRDGVVDVLPPDKHSVGVSGSEHDVLAGTDTLTALSSVFIDIAAVVPLVELQTGQVTIFCHPP